MDSAALGEFAEQVTGRDGVLASAARMILGQLGLDDPVSAAETVTDAELIDLVTAELGSDWPRLVAPAFDGRKAVLFDDRWASAREDLARLWLRTRTRSTPTGHGSPSASRVPATSLRPRRIGGRARRWPRAATCTRRCTAAIAAGAENPGKGRYTNEIAVVTGASKGSIAASVVAQLLDGGAHRHRDHVASSTTTGWRSTRRSTATTPASARRCGWFRPTWRPTPTSTRWSSGWATSRRRTLGRKSIHLKDALTPTLLFPFAAPRVAGDLSEAGSRSEMEMKVLLWAVQRLIGGLSHIGADRDIAARLHVVLPGSPNRGMFGGDGAYGESKSALDAVVTRWKAESSWAQRVSLAHALIGWTKGTGLMGHNDAIVGAVEEAGVTTYTTEEMAAMLLGLCTSTPRAAAREPPIQVDLTGGLARSSWTWPRWLPRPGRRWLAEGRRRKLIPMTRTRSRRCRHRRVWLRLGAAAGVGRPRRRPGRPGGHRRWRRTRPVRIVADPLRDGGRQRTVGRRRARAGLDHRPGQVGGRPEAGLVRHRFRRSGGRGRDRRALPRHRRGTCAASASSSTTVRSARITPRRCW